jgi:hypothetical protein
LLTYLKMNGRIDSEWYRKAMEFIERSKMGRGDAG